MDARSVGRRFLWVTPLIALGASVVALWILSGGGSDGGPERGHLPLSPAFFDEFPPVDGKPAWRLFVVESEQDLGHLTGFIDAAAPTTDIDFEVDVLIAFVGWHNGRAMLIDAVIDEDGLGVVELAAGERSREAGQGELSLPIHAVTVSRDVFAGDGIPQRWEARWGDELVAGSRRFDTGWYPSPLVYPDGSQIYDTISAGVVSLPDDACFSVVVAVEPSDLSALDSLAGVTPPVSETLGIDFSTEIVMALRASSVDERAGLYLGHIAPSTAGGTVNLWWEEPSPNGEPCRYHVVAIRRDFLGGADVRAWSFLTPVRTVFTLP